jgi:hypothetical protein
MEDMANASKAHERDCAKYVSRYMLSLPHWAKELVG